MAVKELKEFKFKNYYKRIGFTKEYCYNSVKHEKKKDLLSFATKLIKSS